jgi:hypothetical protein
LGRAPFQDNAGIEANEDFALRYLRLLPFGADNEPFDAKGFEILPCLPISIIHDVPGYKPRLTLMGQPSPYLFVVPPGKEEEGISRLIPAPDEIRPQIILLHRDLIRDFVDKELIIRSHID